MGKSHFVRNASIAVIVLGVTLIASELLKKSTDSNQSTSFKFLKSNFEENKTLDRQYKSVALEIEAFIKKQKLSYSKTTNVVKEINSTKAEKKIAENNLTIEKKTKIVKNKPLKKIYKTLPKLAIIMDDIGFLEEIEKIKNIPFPITPSIFPPNEYYPDTPKIAKKFKHHMVHFPMEAYKYKNIREQAINVSDKVEVIEKKVKRMQKNFPDALAINNHTGSKYTCDFDAMEQFFSVLNRYDIDFIDSRTSSGSQCQKAGKLLKKKVLQRDVFLDNRADIVYIKNQLKEAVRLAKKNGQAIAICHPKEMTFEALMSCESILEGVELVYINELL